MIYAIMWSNSGNSKRKKSDGHILYDSTYLTCLEQVNLWRQRASQWWQGLGEGRRGYGLLMSRDFAWESSWKWLELHGCCGCTFWMCLILTNCEFKNIYFIIYVYCVWAYIYMYVQVPTDPRRGLQMLRSWSYRSLRTALCGLQELDSDPL